jgi:uncharacterized protein (TIGR00251 family)
MWYKIEEDRVILSVKASPNSSKNQISGLHNELLKIKIKAPAVEGAANKELIKFISKVFKLPKSEIEFISGESSKRKLLKIPLNEKVKEFIKEMESAREGL